jgi:hypothetical protein
MFLRSFELSQKALNFQLCELLEEDLTLLNNLIAVSNSKVRKGDKVELHSSSS